jgi:hypothetical protein
MSDDDHYRMQGSFPMPLQAKFFPLCQGGQSKQQEDSIFHVAHNGPHVALALAEMTPRIAH